MSRRGVYGRLQLTFFNLIRILRAEPRGKRGGATLRGEGGGIDAIGDGTTVYGVPLNQLVVPGLERSQTSGSPKNATKGRRYVRGAVYHISRTAFGNH